MELTRKDWCRGVHRWKVGSETRCSYAAQCPTSFEGETDAAAVLDELMEEMTTVPPEKTSSHFGSSDLTRDPFCLRL